MSTDGEVPPSTFHSADLKTKLRTASLVTSASQVLKKYEEEFFEVVDPKHNLLRLKRKNVITESLTSKIESADRKDAQEILFEHMHHNADVATLTEYCKMAIAADAFPKMQKLGEKMLNELALEGTTSIGLAESSSDHSSDLETYKLDIVSCDLSVVTSKKNPQDAIKSLFFNAYSLLVHILGTCFSTIKAVAMDAVRMKQVAASREKVMEVADVSSLFECLEIDKKWDDLHFLDVAISRLPPATKAAARMVLGHYKSHLGAYRKAVSIKEGKIVFDRFQHKRDRKDESTVIEITVDKEIDEYTCDDCLILWKEFLVAKLEIPEDSIQFSNARPGNSTTLLFTVPHSCVEGLEKKLSQPDVMWTMKELGILQIRVVGMLNVAVREAIPTVTIREGLESGVNFIALTKFWSPLICSLVDGVPEAKDTQFSQIQPYSAASAELSVPEPVVEASASASLLKDLLLAAEEGSLQKVQSFLDGGRCRVNDKDEEGFTAILKAALNGHLTVLRTLVEQYGGNLLHREKRRRNAFLLCAMAGHLAVAEYLTPKMEGHLFDSDDAGYTALHFAAQEGQLSMVEYLVRSCGFDVKAKDKWGNTPLLTTAQEGHAEIAHFLLENGSSVQEQNNDGMTPVLLAARYGHKVIVQELCEIFGADILHRKKDGLNAFDICAVSGHLAIAKYLAPKMEGHLFDSDDDGYTALHFAAQEGQLSMVKYLVKSCGFDVKAIDKWGNSPFLIASQKGHAGVARFLLVNGNSVQEQNIDGWTAVLLAARYGHKVVVQELCEIFGADILHRKKGGSNAFLLCAEGGHLAVAEYLAPRMEGHLFDSDDADYTALHWAAQEGQLSMVKYLVKSCGFDVKAVDKWGNTPLLRATQKGHEEVTRFLLENGSSIKEQNNRGRNAFLLCAEGGNLAVAEYLAPKMEGHLFDSDVDGHTILHLAAYFGQLSMVKHLVKSCGLDLEAKDKWGNTPLLVAAENDHAEVVCFLLESGSVSYSYEMNSFGESALQIAVCKGHLDVVKVFVQYYRDLHIESEVDQYHMDLADDYNHRHVVEYLSNEFPSLKTKVPVPQLTMYPSVWSTSGPFDPDY